MDTPAIEIKNLVKHYGKVKAVDGLDLTVHPGEIFGFLGPNGAGKTTTVRIMTTLTKPDEGEARVFGHDVVKEAVAAKSMIGVCPQQTNVDAELSVYENLKLHGLLHRMNPALRESRIDELLDFTGLADRRKAQAKVLSGGFKRRLMIARALLHQPRILFLDEPTVGLDPPDQAAAVGTYPGQPPYRGDHLPDHPLHRRGREALPPGGHHRPGQDHRPWTPQPRCWSRWAGWWWNPPEERTA